MAKAGSDAHTADLLGDAIPSWENDLYVVPRAEPGKCVDLSGSSSSLAAQPRPPSEGHGNNGSSRFGDRGASSLGGGSSGGSSTSMGSGPALSRGPASIEGGVEFSLNDLSLSNIRQQLATRPIAELVRENGRHLVDLPRFMVRAYSSAAQRYLRPWSEFLRVRPGQTVDGFRRASERGELQIHIQRNVLANVKTFCPNYAFVFLAMLFMFVATSPTLLCMLGVTGGGWSHALRSDNFRNRPWTLQIGGVYVPLGANIKMAMMSLPTLLLLHFCMGPVLWSAALYSSGIGLAHAALRDRDHDDDSGEAGGPGGPSTVRIEEIA